MNLICLNQIEFVSNHKCLAWESSSVPINMVFFSILNHPRTIEKVHCSERGSPSWLGKVLGIIALLLILYPCAFLHLSNGATHGRSFQHLLKMVLPIFNGSSVFRVFAWSRTLRGTHYVGFLLHNEAHWFFRLSTSNIHTISCSQDVLWGQSVGRAMANPVGPWNTRMKEPLSSRNNP